MSGLVLSLQNSSTRVRITPVPLPEKWVSGLNHRTANATIGNGPQVQILLSPHNALLAKLVDALDLGSSLRVRVRVSQRVQW